LLFLQKLLRRLRLIYKQLKVRYIQTIIWIGKLDGAKTGKGFSEGTESR